MEARSPLDLIGDTPLIELRAFQPRPGIRIFAKLEGQNPSGSIKDRVALALVQAAEREGKIRPGDTLVEASSGNTAIALAAIARQKGYSLIVVLPCGVPETIVDVLELLGTDIRRVPPGAGMKGAIDAAEQIARETGAHPVSQFSHLANPKVHYRTTGAEILAQCPSVDVFVAGIGTGGTIMGVGRRLREARPDVRIIGVEPRMGERLQGLRSLDDAFEVPLLDLNQLDGRFLVTAARSIRLVEALARKEGILAGVSGGATLSVALRVAEGMEKGDIVVMFGDGGWKYLPSRPWDAARADDPCLDEIHWW